MLEKSLGELAAVTSAGRIGHAACRYGCPGCPLTRNADALSIRIVGYDGDILEKIKILRTGSLAEAGSFAGAGSLAGAGSSGSGRFIELASGDIPADADALRKVREAGVRRIVIPVFGVGEDHDRRVGVAGSFDQAMKVLELSQAVGIERMLIAPLNRSEAGLTRPAAGLPGFELSEERTITRLAWKHRAALGWANVNADEPLCIADNFE